MRTLLATALLLGATQAGATEIGNTKTKGIGLTVGVPSAVTGKIWLDQKSGISGYFGAQFGGGTAVGLRVQYDREFVELADVPWSRMDLHWFVGGAVSHFPGFGLGLFGAVGGVGFDMQFHEFPLEAFAEVGPIIGGVPGNGQNLAWGYMSTLGARWYF